VRRPIIFRFFLFQQKEGGGGKRKKKKEGEGERVDEVRLWFLYPGLDKEKRKKRGEGGRRKEEDIQRTFSIFFNLVGRGGKGKKKRASRKVA